MLLNYMLIDIFKQFDPIAILKLGLVGLIFILFYLCYLLFAKELARNRVRKPALLSILFFAFLCFASSCLYVFGEFLKDPKNVDQLFEKKDLDPTSLEEIKASQLPEGYSILSNYRFAYRNLDTSRWSNLNQYTGISGIIEANAPSGNMDSLKKVYEREYSASPIYDAITNQVMFISENKNTPLNIVFTDSTSNPEIKFDMARARAEMIRINKLDTNNIAQKEELAKSLKQYFNYHYLNNPNILYTNRLVITILDRKNMPLHLKNMSLANFFKSYLPTGEIDEFSSKENRIFIKSANTYNHVSINGQPGNFRADIIYLLTKNDRFIYQVKATYSPQTSSTPEVYGTLNELINSFRLLSN